MSTFTNLEIWKPGKNFEKTSGNPVKLSYNLVFTTSN